MRLPNARFAVVPVEKLVGYLLDESHPVGRHKARVFARVGYSRNHIGVLRRDLIELAQSRHAALDSRSAYGVKWRVAGVLIGPFGTPLNVRTIWIVRHGEFIPRLVTAFPERTST